MSTLGTRMASLDAMSLKLHTAADGVVWFADGTHVPIVSGLTVDDFAQSLGARQRPFVRVLGASLNAALITRLWPYCRDDRGRLQVASPAICVNDAERANPEIVLYRMRQVRLPPSLGGWHDLSCNDDATYALAAAVQRDAGVGSQTLPTARAHPVWPALTFIQGLSECDAAQLLCFILDPRWYVNLENPDRPGRLQLSLGLRPAVQRRVTKGQPARNRDMARCAVVLRVWSGEKPTGAAWRVPGNFLWRIWRAAGGGAKGDLAASQKLIVFLRYNWLHALYKDTKSSGRDPVFLPDMLFRGDHEVAAFNQHMRQRRGTA